MVTAAGLSSMTRDELNGLPYGAIRLSSYGAILSYNATEARWSGRSPDRVLGRNFLLDVAPCTDVQEFHGRFRELATVQGSMQHVFRFEFPFDPPARVSTTLLRERGDESVWVLVEQAGEAEPSDTRIPSPNEGAPEEDAAP